MVFPSEFRVRDRAEAILGSLMNPRGRPAQDAGRRLSRSWFALRKRDRFARRSWISSIPTSHEPWVRNVSIETNALIYFRGRVMVR
jgi:hypothetical protein